MKVYIDIETIPDQRPDAFDRYLDMVKPPGNIKKPESIDKWMLENAESKAEDDYCKTGLDGLHGEICSISFAVDDGGIEAVTRGWNENNDERSLLDMFWFMLVKEIKEKAKADDDVKWPRLEWIGHNLLDFDLRFLKQRSMINSIKPGYPIPADARHGSGQAFDTMKEWAGWRGYVKQDELCEVFNIISPAWAGTITIDGSQVWDLFKAGEYEKISRYNRLDVWKVREIYKRMMYID